MVGLHALHSPEFPNIEKKDSSVRLEVQTLNVRLSNRNMQRGHNPHSSSDSLWAYRW